MQHCRVTPLQGSSGAGKTGDSATLRALWLNFSGQGKLLAQQSATQLFKSIAPQWLLCTVFSLFAFFWHEKQYFLLPLYFSCKLVKSYILPGGQKRNFSPTPIHQFHTLLTLGQQFCTSIAHALQFRLQWSTTSPSTWNSSFPLLLLPMPAAEITFFWW